MTGPLLAVFNRAQESLYLQKIHYNANTVRLCGYAGKKQVRHYAPASCADLMRHGSEPMAY
jgi:hypothetical protein